MSAPRSRGLTAAGIRYCVGVFLLLRVGLTVLAVVGVALLPNAEAIPRAEELGIPGPVDVPGWPAHGIEPGWHNAVTSFERFDALWFLRIADEGYRIGDQSAVFFPLYPMATRVLGFLLGGRPLAAALIVSNLAFLGALLALYALTELEHSTEVARRAVLYAALFPTSFFFLAPYSESLFLLLAVSAFLAARRGRWWAAGLLGLGAALTRSIGVVLAVALAVEALHQRREGRRRVEGALLWSTLPVLGMLGYLAFWQVKAGDWFAPFSGQSRWLREGTAPWVTLWRATREAVRWIGQYPGGYHLLDWVIVVPVLALAAYAVLRVRPGYSVYLWGSILAPLVLVFEARPLMSMPRFALTMFPVFWAMALLTSERRRIPHGAVVAFSAAGLGLLTLLFVNWYYIF